MLFIIYTIENAPCFNLKTQSISVAFSISTTFIIKIFLYSTYKFNAAVQNTHQTAQKMLKTYLFMLFVIIFVFNLMSEFSFDKQSMRNQTFSNQIFFFTSKRRNVNLFFTFHSFHPSQIACKFSIHYAVSLYCFVHFAFN